jgi:outer membrane protein assembly factor BamB
MSTFVRSAIAFLLLAASAPAAGFPAGAAYVGTEVGIVTLDLETGAKSAPLPGCAGELVVGVTFGPDGRLYASLYSERRVAVLDSTGVEVDSIALPQAHPPMNVEFGADGLMYVATQHGLVFVHTPDGTALNSFAVGTGGDYLSSIAIGADGHLFAAISNKSKLAEVDPSGVVLHAFDTLGLDCYAPTTLAPAPGGGFFTTPIPRCRTTASHSTSPTGRAVCSTWLAWTASP